jgi:hypothetical protein
MLKIDNLKEALDKFGDQVVSDAETNLQNSGKVDTGNLKNSLTNLGAKVSKNSIQLNIKMQPYGAFVDKGVRGVGGVRQTTSAFKRTNNKGKMWKQNGGDSPYSFKEGRKPSVKHFIQWSEKRGLNAFAVREAVYRQGIKPNHFLSNAVEKNIKLLSGVIQDAFGLDVENTVAFLIKSNFNNK